jgi:formylglycine-generating enzyme required for sulfatase activity
MLDRRMLVFAGIGLIVLGAMAGWAATAAPRAGTPEARRDCEECPRIVVVPAGSFVIGSPASEPERAKNESPQRTVTLPSFALSETEVTRAQFTAFAKDTRRVTSGGCNTVGDGNWNHDAGASWTDPRFLQADDHPVVCVSWEDARDYAAWLAKKTGRDYRLPSDAEWEYAVRAGTTSAYFWGASVDDGCRSANFGDQGLERALPALAEVVRQDRATGNPKARFAGCDDGGVFTTPAGSYAANPFGLRDMTGNAWEWVEDCYEVSYDTLPLDGKAREKDGCDSRIVRGGSWDDYPTDVRSASRHHVPPTSKRDDGGFRVACSLGQS